MSWVIVPWCFGYLKFSLALMVIPTFIWTSQEPLDPEAQVRIEGLKEQVLKLQAMLRRRCAEADGQAIGCRWQVIFVRRIHVIH